MKTCISAMSMLTLCLSCGGATGLPEDNGFDGETPKASTSASPESGESTKVVTEVVTKVVTKAAPRAVDACRACNGDWGMHGLSDAISQTESCDCRTRDSGKRCTDGIDCQGVCVANADNPEYVVVDVGPLALGFLVGRCSEFVTVFGCNVLVDTDARDHGPVSVVEPPPVLCVD